MNQYTIIPTFPALRSAVLDRLHDYLNDHGASLDSLIRQVRADAYIAEWATLQEITEQVQATRDAQTLVLDLSHICSAPSARLSHFPFEGDRAFPAQC